MSILTAQQIRYLLDLLSYETVAEFSEHRVVKKSHGYREGEPGTIQAALSMMLEVKARAGV